MTEKIDRFEIIEKLGQGAMAIVYKAYDPEINRTLAIKILHQEKCTDEEYAKRFLSEAKAAGHLSHQNIVTIFDVGEIDNRPYIVMELLEGTPLDKVMDAGDKLSMAAVMSIGIQLAKGLDYAHGKGIVHRDIKPSNIILSPDRTTIKITDFGIAHIADAPLTEETQLGEVLGTPKYMSPEQAKGLKIDGRSDLFSVGVILYQLLTGKRPFTGKTLASLLLQITTEAPVPIEQVAPDIPPRLRQIIGRLLTLQPEKRFQTGRDLAKALIRALEEQREEEKLHEDARILPIRLKWTLLMACVVALTMILSSFYIVGKQSDAMLHQAVDYGASMVRFIATESAVPVLSDDWVAIELFVQETQERQEFKYLVIVDYQGIIRGSSDPGLIGKKYQRDKVRTLLTKTDDVGVYLKSFVEESDVFEFDTAILFQNKDVGTVVLGLSRDPLKKVAHMTRQMMLLLVLVTTGSVALVTYLLGIYIAGPLKTLHKAIVEVGEGNYHYRIEKKRSDEFGQLFTAFDVMIKTVQDRFERKKNSNSP